MERAISGSISNADRSRALPGGSRSFSFRRLSNLRRRTK